MQLTKKSVTLIAVIIYLLSTGVSYAVTSTLLPSNVPGRPNRFAGLIAPLTPGAGKGKVQVAEDTPKTEACPLNGKLFTKAERDAWETRTPLAVMIENHVEARPQSGLSNADIVYEAIAEGGITRFMAMVYCDAQDKDVLLAPVRSARTYFIDWASGYQKPLYVHVGGANLPGPADALGQIQDYGWAGDNDLNQFSIGFPTFARNYDRVQLANGKSLATEHTMETSSERIWEYALENRDIEEWTGANDFAAWSFQDDQPANDPSATNIEYEFWSGYKDFGVRWEYQPDSNQYLRTMGEEPHLDQNNGQQLAFKNVVVLKTTEEGPIDELKHMLYETIGEGEALIFQNGEVVEADWEKPTRASRIEFTVKGKPVEFVRGPIWISVLDTSNEVIY